MISVQVSRNCIQLRRVIQGLYDLDETIFISEPEKMVAVFQNYSKCFGDALALGVFDYISKHTRYAPKIILICLKHIWIQTDADISVIPKQNNW